MKQFAKGVYIAIMIAAALAYTGYFVLSTNEMVKPSICECVDYSDEKVSFRMKAGHDSFCGVIDLDEQIKLEQKGNKFTFIVDAQLDKVVFSINNKKGKQVATKEVPVVTFLANVD